MLCYSAVASLVNQLVKFRRIVSICSSMTLFRVSTGYFVAVGTISFATCYQHGPLTSELSITLFTWTLQLTAFVFIYCGVTIPQVAYAIIAAMLCSKGLGYPLGAAWHIGRCVCIYECPVSLYGQETLLLIMKKSLTLPYTWIIGKFLLPFFFFLSKCKAAVEEV